VPATYVRNAGRGQLSSEWRHNENDVIMRTGAASAVGARLANDVIMRWRHNNNSWLMEIWRLATCGHGWQRSSNNDWLLLCLLVTSSLVAPGAGVLACHRPWLKSSLLKMVTTFGQFSERILRHSKTCDVWWLMTPYIEKEDSDLRPYVSARERLQISCYRYWLTALC